MFKSYRVEIPVTEIHDYHFMKFDGTNSSDLLEFLNFFGFNSNKAEEFIKRPEDIPNLDILEFSKWWTDNGFVYISNKRRYKGWNKLCLDKGHKVNTHDYSNRPDWDKDEVMQFYISNVSSHYDPNCYYCHKIGIKIGDIFCYDEFSGKLEIHNENGYIPEKLKTLFKGELGKSLCLKDVLNGSTQ